MIATREIRYKGRIYRRGEPLPDDPVWQRAWLEAGSASETVSEPGAARPKAESVVEPGEEVLTSKGTQVTDRLPKRRPPSKK